LHKNNEANDHMPNGKRIFVAVCLITIEFPGIKTHTRFIS
jgi:hypothetical protein